MMEVKMFLVLTWALGPPLPQEKDCRITALVNGQIVTVGGTYWETKAPATRPTIKHWMSDVLAYDIAGKKWSKLPAYPRRIAYGAAAAVNGVLYVAGGVDGVVGGDDAKEAFDECYKMDFWKRPLAWEKIAPLPLRLWNSNAAVIESMIFLAGGRTGDPSRTGKSQVVADILVYDTAQGQKAQWKKAGKLPSPREGSVVAGCGHTLYIAGGAFDDGKISRPLNEMLAFDPAKGRCIRRTPLPKAICWPGGAALGDRFVVVLGGEVETGDKTPEGQPKLDFSREVWIYDAQFNTYQRGRSLPRAVLDCGVVADNKAIYVCGGENSPNRTRANWFQIGKFIAK